MDDKEIIQKIKKLKNIEPRENWVMFNKERIFQTEPQILPNAFSFRRVFQWKTITASVIILLVALFGLTAVVQNSLPGDTLYPVKRATENIKSAFVKNDSSLASLETADTRVKELQQVAQTNQTSKLPVALQESNKALEKAASDISKKNDKDNPQQTAKIMKKVIDINQSLNKTKSKLHIPMPAGKVLADRASQLVENSSSTQALAQIVEQEIKDKEQTALTPEGKKCLNSAKKYFDNYEKGELEKRRENLSKAFQTLLTCE